MDVPSFPLGEGVLPKRHRRRLSVSFPTTLARGHIMTEYDNQFRLDPRLKEKEQRNHILQFDPKSEHFPKLQNVGSNGNGALSRSSY